MRERRSQIIVVDDLNFHLVSIKERLKEHYDIFAVPSAEKLFELLDRMYPDLILLDINMPEVDGYETLKKLKSDPDFAEIPVIFLTSKSDKKSIIKGMNLGAIDYVAKPFTDSNLVECIEFQLNPGIRNANKPVILAVDDDPSELKSIFYFLQDRYNIYTLPEPEKIKNLLTMITPDLFLLDCQMPVLSGFELVPVIRKIPPHDETPIVFITSAGTIDNISVAMHLGASDFIAKPIDNVVLNEKIAALMNNYMIRRRIRSL